MSTAFMMPALGESVEQGVITRWLKGVGDTVEADEPLLEVATDKVDTEIGAPYAGTIRELLAAEESTVAVGDPLAIIEPLGAPGSIPETPPAPSADTLAPPATALEAVVIPSASDAESAVSTATVAVLDRIPETTAAAPAEAVVQAPTVVSAAAPTPAAPAAPVVTGSPEKMTRLRQTVAKRMVQSLQVSAQLTTVLEVDVTALARLRAARKDEFLARTGIKLSFLPFFAKAAVEALAVYPMLNASVSDDNTEVTYHRHRHLGIAVDSPRGLMVPVIRDASDLSISGLAGAIADLAERTRAGSISPDELGGGTFTLTNTGSRGALFDTPIINQPQTGILGTGAVVDRVVPSADGFGGHTLSVCSMVYLSITYDHRIVDGADAARFLTTIKTRLEKADFAADL